MYSKVYLQIKLQNDIISQILIGGVTMIESKITKKCQITINVNIYDRYLSMANSYGMTVNALMVYVLGQFIENTENVKNRITDDMITTFTEVMKKVGENNVE